MNKSTLFLLDLSSVLWAAGAFVSVVLWLTSLLLNNVDLGYHTVRSSEQYFIFMVSSFLISFAFIRVRRKVT
jgi:hypothetical protein